MSSLDPQKDKILDNGMVYAVFRYNEIVRERFYITSATNVSYADTGLMTPKERQLYIDFIIEERQAQKKALEEVKNRNRANSSRR